MDKNTFTGLFLILIILVASFFLNKPSEQELKKEHTLQDSIARSKNKTALKSPAAVKPAVAVPDPAMLKGPFGSARIAAGASAVLENELIKVNIGSRGGRVESVQLKNLQTYRQQPIILFQGNDTRFGLIFNAQGAAINTGELYFSPSSGNLMVSKADSGSLTMRLTYSEGKFIDYVYTLKGNSYKVGLTIIASGMQGVITGGQDHLVLNWETALKLKEKDIISERNNSTAYYKTDNDAVEHLEKLKDEKKEIPSDKGKIRWVSFKQHFFSNVLISKNGFDKGTVSVSNGASNDVVKVFTANLQLPFTAREVNAYPMEFYFGPNKFNTLEKQGYDIEKQIDMGYWPLKYINRFAVLPIFNFFEGFNWSYGLIILALTILLKVILFPLTYKSYLSMAKMKVLKPEMDEIKGKVGDDNPTLLQQEYLKLYKKAGVNPLGGCLPMLLQLPIIMAFFFFFPNLFELRGESFLWMEDLSTYDDFFRLGFTLPFLGNHISLMCILMTISTLIYTYFNNQVSGATGQMKYIGYITPVIFFGVLNSYPAGLNYYYFLANMLTFAQQFLIRQFVNDEKIHARIQEHKKKPVTEKKKGGFQKRMEDYMKTQQSAKTAGVPASTSRKK